jgi:hypothetical protein
VETETELYSPYQQRDNTRESLRLIELRESEFVLPSESQQMRVQPEMSLHQHTHGWIIILPPHHSEPSPVILNGVKNLATDIKIKDAAKRRLFFPPQPTHSSFTASGWGSLRRRSIGRVWWAASSSRSLRITRS